MNGGTIEQMKDITLTATVETGKNKSFTLDLKGNTLDSGTNTDINLWSGTLTITDTVSGGKITSTNTSSGTINLSGRHLVVGAVTVENTALMIGYLIYGLLCAVCCVLVWTDIFK